MLKTMDEGIQGRRLGAIGCWTEDWETEKVGDAKLFEKPRSGVRGIPRYSDIADDDDDCAYDVLDYCRKFDRIAQHCMEKKVLTEYTAGVWFIYGLPVSTASKLIRKLEIDTEDPSTIDYKKVLEHVVRQTASDKAIQQMNAIRNPS